MNTHPNLHFTLLAAAVLTLPLAPAANAQSDDDAIKLVRSVIKADRQAVVAESLQLAPTEAANFWPLYQDYRAQMDKHSDNLVKLVKEYAASYPNVPDERAVRMLKDFTSLEKELVSTRAWYLKKFGRILPAPKNLRFAQVENRLDLALRLQLAAILPLVPIEGRMTGTTTTSAVLAAGVPGGVVVQTHQVVATVAAIDRANRQVTCVNADGIKETVKAGPEVVNFDQIRVGDRVKVTATEAIVVQMAAPGETVDDGANTVVALAPKGAKPGGLMAQTTQVTARIIAIDQTMHKATLQFDDGSSKTVPVRSDVDLRRRKVGDRVMIRVTESVALSVEKP